MKHKQYRIAPEELALLNADAVDFYLEFDQDFVFGYSPVLLNSVCEAHPHLAPKFVAVLTEMAAGIDRRHDCEYARPGTYAVFDDKDWLANQAAVARRALLKGGIGPAPVTHAGAVEQPRPIDPRSDGFAPGTEADLSGSREETMAQQEPSQLVALFLPALNIGQFAHPTIFARSSIFGAGRARNSDRMSWSPSAGRVITRFSGMRQGQTTLAYTGEELWTGDQETWTSLLTFAATTALGEDVNVRILDVLHSMPGRGTTGSGSRARLRAEGARLKAATLKIRTTDRLVIESMQQCLPENKSVQEAHKRGFVELSFSLLEQFTASTDCITYRISRELRALFGANLYTWYDHGTYYSLPSKGLARRLYILYNSHYACYPLTVPELIEFLGISARTVRNVVGALREAHVALVAAGLVQNWMLRQPTAEERKNCVTPCFVVTHPARRDKTVHLETARLNTA
jgi:hypothetical protein